MTALIRTWILGIAAAAVFCAAATELTPEGTVKRVVRVLCGVVLTAALVSPLFDFDFPAYALRLSRYREQAAALTGQAEETRGELNRAIIEENLEAYILDKAQSLGASLSEASVTLQWREEGIWVPVAAELTGKYNDALAGCLEGELGIGRAAQTWREAAGESGEMGPGYPGE